MASYILENLWKLRTDPFYPEVDCKGQAIQREALESSLNPLVDERVLPFYFDVYDWSTSTLVREISSDSALKVFPTARDLPRNSALLLLLSGSMETGLDSLANLLLHKIRLTGGRMPLIVDLPLEGRDKVRNVAAVARRIIWSVRIHPNLPATGAKVVEQMQAEYDRVHKEEGGRADGTYTELFLSFRDLLKSIGQEVVLKVTEGGDHDSWVRIYDSAKVCCAYIIVMTSDFAYAKTCYNSMVAFNKNIAWVRALPLGQERAKQYLALCIAAQQVAGAGLPAGHNLLPFTADAIDALYELGSTGKHGMQLTYPVGWLRRTLYQAFIDQHDTLTKTHAASALAALDPMATYIGAEAMRRVRERLNSTNGGR